jgi:formylglycine-generating enzyme required for sulfatase activity
MTTNKPNRVLRGGDWLGQASDACCAYRIDGFPDYANLIIGFRPVIKPTTLQQNGHQ